MPLGWIQYGDLLGKVRSDNIYHSIRSLVQPDNPEVKDVADRLIQLPDFIEGVQQFVHQFTPYGREVGDFWGTPSETMTPDDNGEYWADCDCSAILVCSILRCYIDPLSAFVVVGKCKNDVRDEGHAWVVVNNPSGTYGIIETTASPDVIPHGLYTPDLFFNDKYAFATKQGVKEWDMKTLPLIPGISEPVDLKEVAYAWNH